MKVLTCRSHCQNPEQAGLVRLLVLHAVAAGTCTQTLRVFECLVDSSQLESGRKGYGLSWWRRCGRFPRDDMSHLV